MMQADTLKVYEILKDNWGEKKASTVLSYLENTTDAKVEAKFKAATQTFATKDDISHLEMTVKEDISHLEMAVKEDISHLEMAVNEDISRLEMAVNEDISRLEILIANKYANTIKWLFLFWVGTIGSVVAIIKFL